MYFFFSSRMRHTRLPRDWSSDVCSSYLDTKFPEWFDGRRFFYDWTTDWVQTAQFDLTEAGVPVAQEMAEIMPERSEERSEGKRWSTRRNIASNSKKTYRSE